MSPRKAGFRQINWKIIVFQFVRTQGECDSVEVASHLNGMTCKEFRNQKRSYKESQMARARKYLNELVDEGRLTVRGTYDGRVKIYEVKKCR